MKDKVKKQEILVCLQEAYSKLLEVEYYDKVDLSYERYELDMLTQKLGEML